ncbi:MAG: GTPase Era [Gemmatimonadota bacterium]
MTNPATRSGHIALAGLPNVGKSTLLNTLVGEHLAIVSPKAQATRLPVVGVRTDGDVQFVFHDLPGLLDPGYLMQQRMRTAALDQLAKSDIVLYLHPANEAPAPPFTEVARLARAPKADLVLVYTKGDRVTIEERQRLRETGALVTAENGEGVQELLDRLGAMLPERPFEFDPEDVGTQPMRFFVTEYLREAAFQLLEEEVPYSFAAQVEEFREDDRPVYIRVTLYVERETQKAIVIGAGGRTIKALGTHARTRLEQLMGLPVYLDCWVKVIPNWRKNAAALSRLGFPDSDSVHDLASLTRFEPGRS